MQFIVFPYQTLWKKTLLLSLTYQQCVSTSEGWNHEAILKPIKGFQKLMARKIHTPLKTVMFGSTFFPSLAYDSRHRCQTPLVLNFGMKSTFTLTHQPWKSLLELKLHWSWTTYKTLYQLIYLSFFVPISLWFNYPGVITGLHFSDINDALQGNEKIGSKQRIWGRTIHRQCRILLSAN